MEGEGGGDGEETKGLIGGIASFLRCVIRVEVSACLRASSMLRRREERKYFQSAATRGRDLGRSRKWSLIAESSSGSIVDACAEMMSLSQNVVQAILVDDSSRRCHFSIYGVALTLAGLIAVLGSPPQPHSTWHDRACWAYC